MLPFFGVSILPTSAARRRRARVIEGDDVGGAGVAEVGFVEASDGGIIDEINGEDVCVVMEIVAEKRTDNAAQMAAIYWTGTLLVFDAKLRDHAFPTRHRALRGAPRKRQ